MPNQPRQLTAAAGAGFYRYWHVPHPDHQVVGLDSRDTRRADVSLIGPGALALVSLAAWITGRVGIPLLLDRSVTAPLESLPWAALAVVVAGLAGVVLAAVWWAGTARLRARVARGVAAGRVARIPDNPDQSSVALHAAVTRLGRALRDLPAPSPLAGPAFRVLCSAVSVVGRGDSKLGRGRQHRPPRRQRQQRQQRPHRLRRRCDFLADQLAGTPAPTHRGSLPGERDPSAESAADPAA